MHGLQLATDIIAATTTITSKHPTPMYACVTASYIATYVTTANYSHNNMRTHTHAHTQYLLLNMMLLA